MADEDLIPELVFKNGLQAIHGTVATAQSTAESAVSAVDDLAINVPSRALESFGVTGDGTTDDASAIQDAIDWALANNGRIEGTPGANYRIGSTWPVISGSGSIVFDLNGAFLTGLAGSTVILEVAGKQSKQVLLRNFNIDGLGRSSSSVGLRQTNCQSIGFDRVRIRYCGVAFDAVNAASPGNPWTEQNDWDRLDILTCGTGVRLRVDGGNASFAGNKLIDPIIADCDTLIDVQAGASWYGGVATGMVMFVSAAGSPVGINIAGSVAGSHFSGRMESTTSNTPQAVNVESTGNIDTAEFDFTLTGSGFQTPHIANAGVTTPRRAAFAGGAAGRERGTALHRATVSDLAAPVMHVSEARPRMIDGQPVGWVIPSVGHMAVYTGVSWVPITPATAEDNVACILGEFDHLYDAAATDRPRWPNRGFDGGEGTFAGPTVTVDSDGRPTVAFDGTDDYVQLGDINFAAADSFSVLAVVAQSTFVAANANPIMTTRIAEGSTSSTGWSIRQSTSAGVPAFSICDGGATTHAVSSVTRNAGDVYLIVGRRDVSADSIDITVNSTTEAPDTDTTTGDIASTQPARIGRATGGTNAYSQMDGGYVFGVISRVLTADELTALEAWRAARWA